MIDPKLPCHEPVRTSTSPAKVNTALMQARDAFNLLKPPDISFNG